MGEKQGYAGVPCDEMEKFDEDKILEWSQYVANNTYLSPQEANIFIRIYNQNKVTIAEKLGIEKSQLDSIRYKRIPEKVEKAYATVDICGMMGKYTTKAFPIAGGARLVGCAGKDCDNDVSTAVTKSEFEDFYTKTINKYDDDSFIDNKMTLQFCSAECVVSYEESDKE